MKIEKFLLTIILILSLAGCGGGGGKKKNDDNPITGNPVWKAGFGVVAKSETAFFPSSSRLSTASVSLAMKEITLKRLLAAEPFVFATNPVYSDTGFRTFGIDPTTNVWLNSIKFIYLDWEPLNGVVYYKAYFLGDGSQNKEVWDSRIDNPNDPNNTTIAYLDLGDELSECNLKPGQYQFKVIAYNGKYIKEYPAITVSIGIQLEVLPNPNNYADGSRELSWTPVGGASGYKVGIYSDENLQNRVWDSGTELLSKTIITFDTSLIPDKYYYWVVFAYNVRDGKTVEVTMATSGFTL